MLALIIVCEIISYVPDFSALQAEGRRFESVNAHTIVADFSFVYSMQSYFFILKLHFFNLFPHYT